MRHGPRSGRAVIPVYSERTVHLFWIDALRWAWFAYLTTDGIKHRVWKSVNGLWYVTPTDAIEVCS